MTPKEINKKAYGRYPVKMVPDDDTMGFTSTDVNEVTRMGYIEAYKEISALPTIKGWIARDRYGDLYFYPYYKPKRYGDYWFGSTGVFLRIASYREIGDYFPSIRWEDEPIEVELPIVIKKEK